MAFSQALADGIREMLTGMGVHFEYRTTPDVGIFTMRMKLNCKLQNAQMLILVRDDNYSTLATIPLTADENSRLAVAEYLTRVNFNMRNGNFELDMNSGEIRFKTYVHAADERVELRAARLSVLMPFMMFDRFGDGLLEVLFGYKSPREAYEAVTK